jgi:trimeric autotransporter adhesin
MAHAPKPLLGLLVAAVAFFALYTVALKPATSGTGGTQGTYQSAIAKAHQAVATSDANSVARGGTIVKPPASTHAATPAQASTAALASIAAQAATAKSAAAAAKAATTTATATAASKALQATANATPQAQVNILQSALASHKVVALLFFNPSAADDLAVKQELAAAATPSLSAVKLAVPVSSLAHFAMVTDQVPVNASPTLVVIDRAGQATTVTGFADRFEIAQRVQNALATK